MVEKYSKTIYEGARGYVRSLAAAVAIGSIAIFGGLEARAQDPLKHLTRTVIIDKSALPKDQKDLLQLDNLMDIQREGAANYENEQNTKKIIKNQEEIKRLLKERNSG